MTGRRDFDRRAMFTSAAATALLAASGVSAQAGPRSGGRLRAALSGAARSDCWTQGDGLFVRAVRHTVFEALTEVAADGTLRPALAESWTSHDAGRVWEFTLRPAAFHAGPTLSAEDVVAALGPQAVRMGPQQVRVTLHVPDRHYPFTIVNTLIMRPNGNGTGLYRAVRFDPGRQFLGQRVAQHWRDGQEGWFETVEFVSIPDQSVRAEALRSGMADVADVSADIVRQDRSLTHIGAQAIRRDIGLPLNIGMRQPLDDLAMAARWWRV